MWVFLHLIVDTQTKIAYFRQHLRQSRKHHYFLTSDLVLLDGPVGRRQAPLQRGNKDHVIDPISILDLLYLLDTLLGQPCINQLLVHLELRLGLLRVGIEGAGGQFVVVGGLSVPH